MSALAVPLLALLSLDATAAPAVGDWFEYTFEQRVVGSTGAYVGYTDKTTATGRYEVLEVRADAFDVVAAYTWQYESSEGERDRGEERRTVTIQLTDRRYRGPIDLDDEQLSRLSPDALAAWFWIPPDTPLGGGVLVLDQSYRVDAVEAAAPDREGQRALRLVADGASSRDDDYGQHQTRWHDEYWYDAATGWVLAERFTEQNAGTIEGERGGFELTERLDVTAASYAPALPKRAPAPPEPHERRERAPAEVAAPVALIACGGWAMQVLATLVGIGLLVWLVGRNRTKPLPAKLTGTTFGDVSIQRLRDPLDLAASPDVVCTKFFGPFLEDFARKAALAGDAVHVAVAGEKLVGFAWRDAEADIGTVLTSDDAVADALVRWTTATDFFAEHRFERAPGKPRYNVHETYAVLEHASPSELPYDKSLVRRYEPADQQAVQKLLQGVYGVEASAWLRSQLAAGDLGFVAKIGEAVVGFGLATAVGSEGRLHGLTVDAAFRDRGIGTELLRARLTALARLGATRVISEIATWNVASLHVARANGFADLGELTVQTTSASRAKRTIVRR